MTLQLRCTHSLSLCWLCQIFCNPVSKFQTILHQPHHECFNSQRRSEKRDWAIANKEKISGIPPSPERISTRLLLGIKLAFKEKQSTLDSVVTLAVRDAVDSVLIPALRKQREDIKATNNSVKELREEFEAMAAAAKQTRDRIDSVQATAREDRNAVTDLRNQLKRLTEKMTDMEDKSRKNNVRLVGLPEGMEGSNVAGFLRVNLSKWIPSLKGRNIEIDWAHRMYDGRKKLRSAAYSHLPCAKMAWQIGDSERCSAGLSGEMHAGQCHVTVPDFSPVTASRRKSLVPVLRSMTALGLQPFLAYPAVIKLRHGGEQRCFNSLWKAEDFVGSLSQSGTFAIDPQGSGRVVAALSSTRREGLGGRDGGDADCLDEDVGRRDIDDC